MDDMQSTSVSAAQPHWLYVLLIIATVLLITMSAVSLFLYSNIQKLRAENSKNTNQTTTQEVVDSNSELRITRDQIAWDANRPVEIEKQGWYTDTTDIWEHSNGNGRESNTKYFRVGVVTAGTYKGAEIILTASEYEQMGTTKVFQTYLKMPTQTYSISPIDDWTKTTIQPGKTVSKLVHIDADVPATIAAPGNQRQSLRFDQGSQIILSPEDLQAPTSTVAFTDPTVGTVYRLHANIKDGNSISGWGGAESFLVKDAYGFGRLYTYTPDIFTEKGLASIAWKSGALTEDSYMDVDLGGCGATNVISVVSLTPGKELIEAGKTMLTGEPVYELKDANHLLLKNAYESYKARAVSEQKAQMSYGAFLKTHPLFFWQDPFGRMVKFTSSAVTPLGECGKPVIYLYPQQTERVDVNIDVKGGMSKSEPLYNNGWSVMATPEGKLTNLADGRAYPYLFWEGRGGLYEAPTKGWVVARANVHTFLVEKLSAYGLNAQEIADFVEFWEPRMQSAPYYFVGFHGTRVMDQLAPLTISPKPDAVFRVLMDYKPLTAPISVEAPAPIRPFERHGFSVVEWGGVIRGND